MRIKLFMLIAVIGAAAFASPVSAQSFGDGNPFIRTGPPRATLLQPRRDDAVQPATYDAVLPTGPMMPVASTPTTITPPAGTVLPNYGVSQPPAVLPQQPSMPIPQPPIDVATAAVPPPGIPPAGQPQLSGVAILTHRSADGAEHPLAPVVRWCEDAVRQIEGLRDYTCTFKKREFIDGRLNEQQVLFVKSRPTPLSVYLYFLTPNDIRGQEAIYVEGRNDNRLVAHPVGIKKTLVGTMSLAPTDAYAMEGNRHPITDFGLKRLCERYLEGSRADMNYGECDVQVIENAQVEGRACTCIQTTHPMPRREFKYHLTRLYVDNEWNIPLRYESYAWPQQAGQSPPLIEEYTYSQLKLNVGLSDADFDPKNPSYGFD